MPNRTAKIASAIFASLLAGASLTAITRSAAGAADEECLTTPKGETPQGSHWYYRIDRASKRQCWYLREESEKLSDVAPVNAQADVQANVPAKSSSPSKPASAKPDTAMQSSVANARAELPPQTRVEQPDRNRSAAAISANPTLSDADRSVRPPVAQTQPSGVGSRWLNQSNAFPAANPAPPASPALYEPTVVAEANAAPQTPPPAAGPFAADPSLETPTHSVQMLLAAILGALALAGVMARLIFKFVGTRRLAKRRFRERRGAIWKSAATGRRPSAVYRGADALPPEPHFPRDLDQIGDSDDRIVELLRDFSRKSRRGSNQRQPSNQRQRGVGSFL
jgi:hypothetical protein